ncbi:pyruvate, orthophosphate dikinase [Haloechinothrix alba]|uniref:Pyruvate, orthophosphate dikinase n=1 Tax=Haloechinothrix alba TaxID=664784 RepID=A0A239A8Z7_9PSEU|nr:pyruvate, phosphate dikinase [Haloechinothrix alba]SNR91558.1 pyruvate, orthophosphate dikinase [Haloechinothrix alba]
MTGIAHANVLVLDGSTGQPRETLGGKAWSIEQMRALDVPVPPAFVLTTQVCQEYYDGGQELPVHVWSAVPEAMSHLEHVTGRTFGTGDHPLLVSVRSGAATSMPGMMDTVLNLGMTDGVSQALAAQSGDPAYADDTRERFREQFEQVVGVAAPDDPWEQLRLAIIAVLDSWNSRRAVSYRRDRGISDDGGTAVTVQAMVFGNLDNRSGTGVLFTRNPLSGSAEPYGEWLPRGQGEDIVSGRSDALPLDDLASVMPGAYTDLMTAATKLEQHSRDVQDIEFTVESGTLWLLQTRSAKRSPEAIVRHAVQLQRQGLISVSEALDRIAPEHLETLLAPHIDPAALDTATTVATGKPACPGIATGTVVVDADEAQDRAEAGENVVLARPSTHPDDVAAMSMCQAVLTELGGSTSHAAVACREMGIPCIVGCGEGTVTGTAGQELTVDAAEGTVYKGRPTIVAGSEGEDPDIVQISTWLQEELGGDAAGSLAELLRIRSGQ